MKCPCCQSTDLYKDEDHGFYECEECGEIWGHDEDDPDYDEEPLDLGACCACGKLGPDVRNLMMLDKRAPIPGTGWGCFVCGLPNDGATAALCDDCLNAKAEIKQVIHGNPTSKERVFIEQLQGTFKHLEELHEREQMPPQKPSLIRDHYLPPLGMPLNWRNEASGVLPEAVSAYMNYWIGGGEPTDYQLNLIINYLRHYINAPCWRWEGPELTELRERAKSLRTLKDICHWIGGCLRIGLDPL